MVFLCRTRRCLRETAERSLTGPLMSSGSSSASQWAFRHIPGTGQFALVACYNPHAHVSVHCNLPVVCRREGKQRANKLPRSDALALDIIPFSCQIRCVSKTFPLFVSLQCESRADQLIITGAAFSREAAAALQGPESLKNQLVYSGPYLTQTHLADVVLGTEYRRNPLAEHRFPEAHFFKGCVHFDSSAHDWYGHNPVHTVRPELTDAIARLVSALGVNDELAQLVTEKARLVQQAEKTAWTEAVRATVLKR